MPRRNQPRNLLSLTPTPPNSVYHAAELLTSIVLYLKSSTSPPSEHTGLSWTTDVARILQTSKHGLRIGAAVLYESEKHFPTDSSYRRRFDMLHELNKAGASQERIKFYLSNIKKLDGLLPLCRYHYTPDCPRSMTQTKELRSWLTQTVKDYPSLCVVHVRTDTATVSISRKTNDSLWESIEILEIADTETAIPEDCAALIKQLQKPKTKKKKDVVNVTSITLGPFEIYRTRQYSAPTKGVIYTWFALPKSAETYAYLTAVDISATSVEWKFLGQLLSSTSVLQSLRVHLNDTERHLPQFSEAGVSFPPTLKNLHITLAIHDYASLPILVGKLPALRELYISLGPDLNAWQWAGHLPYVLPKNIWKSSKLGITSLSVTGQDMTLRLLLDILAKSPALTTLRAEWDRQTTPSQNDLGKICKACPKLYRLDLAFSDPAARFPFLPTVDFLTSRLKHLTDLTLPTILAPPVLPSSDLLAPIRAKSPRWPQLIRLELGLFSSDLITTRPDCLGTAHALAQTVWTITELCCTVRRGNSRGFVLPTGVDGRVERGDQWWREVESMVGHYRRGLVWTEMKGEGDKMVGWKWMEVVGGKGAAEVVARARGGVPQRRGDKLAGNSASAVKTVTIGRVSTRQKRARV